MKQVVTRKNKLFIIDKDLIKSPKKDEISNALYAAIYLEFQGASQNPRYKGLSPKDMLSKVNEFANSWLKIRGLI